MNKTITCLEALHGRGRNAETRSEEGMAMTLSPRFRYTSKMSTPASKSAATDASDGQA